MPLSTPKAESVDVNGQPDGWAIVPGFHVEIEPNGVTRMIVAVQPDWLQQVHTALIGAFTPPLGLLYRQRVDRRAPRPEGSPPRDFVALELAPETLVAALGECADLVYHDARNEIWVRGARGEQLILDSDGLMFLYPADPSFRDVLLGFGLPEGEFEAMVDRDYVRHWFHAACDVEERALIDGLGLVEISTPR